MARAQNKANILLVDDHPENLLALEVILEELDQNLVAVRSGEEALKFLLKEDAAVILLDINMPGINGYETASLIRGRDRSRHTPIIFMTAYSASETNVFEGYSIGAVDYIFKPFQPAVLKAKVGVFIDLFKKTNAIEQQTKMLRVANRELEQNNRITAQLNKKLELKSQELHRERDFVNAILDTAGSLVLVLDSDGQIVRFNKTAEEFTGLSFKEIHGQVILEKNLPEEWRETTWDYFQKAKRGERVLSFENEIINAADETRRFVWTLTPLRDPTDDNVYVVAAGADISERHKNEELIRRMNEELEERVLSRTSQLSAKNGELELEIAERMRIETELRSSESRFRRLVDSNLIGIYFSDAEGTIIYANDAFLQIIGYTREQFDSKGLSWTDFTPEEYRERDAEAMRELADTQICRPYEKEYVRRSGERVPILVGKALLEGGENNNVAFVLDLTEQKRAEQGLQAAKQSAERANSAKDQFLAVLSHELRTPLTPVLAIIQMLEEEEDSGLSVETLDLIRTIRRNVELEARLIDDLLDLTRIANGKLQLNLDVVDVRDLLDNVIQICQDEANRKNLTIRTQIGAESTTVEGDPARLQQVLWNLLKNAVKFTPEGGEITVSLRNFKRQLEIEVTDSGIGIREEVLPKIFAAFEQGDKATTRQFGGLGLGLAISKALVEAHKGTISAASEGFEKGASFSVSLSLAEPVQSAPKVRTRSKAKAMAQAKGAHILIVEDNHDTSRAMKHLLERRGYTVSVSHSVVGALSALNETSFDLIISDIGLPDGSGLEIMDSLTDQNRIPGIALSGFGMEEDIRKSLAAGFRSHLVKPVNFDQLFEEVANLTQRKALIAA